MRFLFLLFALTLVGCANARTPAMPHAPAAPEASTDPRQISIREKDGDLVFLHGDGTELSEEQFRTAYLARLHSSDLEDELALKLAKKQNVLAIGLGVSATAVGVTGIVLLPQTKSCAQNASAANREACVKSWIDAAALAAGGVFVLGCEAVKGVDCMRENMVPKVDLFQHAHLNRERASFYVDRYNDALAGVIPTANEPRATPSPKPRAAHVTITPSGVAGTF